MESINRLQASRCKGFSLIEVLVATAILATGLIAASRAALVATNDQGILRDRTLARWVAHNTLAEIRLQPQQAAAGNAFTRPTRQAGIDFIATTRVTATPSPLFSRVEVTVVRAPAAGKPDVDTLTPSDAQATAHALAASHVLARATGFSARP